MKASGAPWDLRGADPPRTKRRAVTHHPRRALHTGGRDAGRHRPTQGTHGRSRPISSGQQRVLCPSACTEDTAMAVGLCATSSPSCQAKGWYFLIRNGPSRATGACGQGPGGWEEVLTPAHAFPTWPWNPHSDCSIMSSSVGQPCI